MDLRNTFLLIFICLLISSSVNCFIFNRMSKFKGSLNQDLNIYSGDNEDGDEYEHWFASQQLDHFNPADNRTWKQRYFVNWGNWKPGNPILFVLGGEGPTSSKYVQDHFITGQYAKEFDAAIVALEHRFYGESTPNKDASTQNLRFLSSEQALADAAWFKQLFEKTFETFGSKWIVFGGSYSGCLSAWLKLKYPQLFTGSYATSAPVLAKEDFPEYLEVVGNSIGSQCSQIVQSGAEKIEELMSSSEGLASLQKMFNLCTPISNEKDKQMMRQAVISVVSGVVQYNNDNVNYQPFNIQKMCQILEEADSPIEGLASVNNDLNNFMNESCTEVSYANSVKELQSESAGRSWTYQTCVEFGFFQTATSPDQPFYPMQKLDLDFYTELCKDIFGEALTPNIDWVNANYGALNLINNTYNTFFPTGSVDPWHVLSILEGNRDERFTFSFFISGTAHCADLYPPSDLDPPSLREARKTGFDLINEWLY